MFGKWMNSYYYGKSGKGDYKKEDLPTTRWQLFWEMLRVRLAGLLRLNLMTVAAWLPLMILIFYCVTNVLNAMAVGAQYEEYLATGSAGDLTQAMIAELDKVSAEAGNIGAAMTQVLYSQLWLFCLWAIPCIAVTGPVKAGLAYVTRNWSRDEHAFIWSDFKDAVKENWKQALGVSLISSLLPVVIYVGYEFYGQRSAQNVVFAVPQMLIVMIGLIWALGCTFMYPMMVSYRVTFGQLIKNSLMIAVGRLPHTVGVRLLLLVPTAVFAAAFWFTGSLLPILLWGGYYLLIGYALSRFVIASFTNAVFDRFINSRMEGVKVNRGLAEAEDDDGEEAPEEQKEE